MKTQVINIRNISGAWEDVGMARHVVVMATDTGRIAAINHLESVYGVAASFSLNEDGDLVIERIWPEAGWAEYQALGPIDIAGLAEEGLEVSETVS